MEVFVCVCMHSEQCRGPFIGVINCVHSDVRYLSLTLVSFLSDTFKINQPLVINQGVICK